MEVISRSFRENMFKTHLKAYVDIEVIVSQFKDIDSLVSYITWITNRLSTIIRPQSFEICFNSYNLREQLVEGVTCRIFLAAVDSLFK
jgi:hypothetical protein